VDPPTLTTTMEREGMEEGYTMSAMGVLRLESGQYNKHWVPVLTEVTLLIGKGGLNCMDVIDRGILIGTNLPHFMLNETMTKRVTNTVSRLQIILHCALGLIPERSSTFEVDPHGVLVNILLGAHNVAQMNAAWVALKTRMQLGVKNFEKYSAQFQYNVVQASPVSTVLELLSHFIQFVCHMSQGPLAKQNVTIVTGPKDFRRTLTPEKSKIGPKRMFLRCCHTSFRL
jgi:hypothetical protein